MTSTKKINGGPAFPAQITEDGHVVTDPETGVLFFPGMSLRDYFAAAALAGQHPGPSATGVYNEADNFASWAYRLADAMLEEREK